MVFWGLIVSILNFFSFCIYRYYMGFIWFILFIFSAFRYNVGTDYTSYVQLYNAIASGNATGVWANKELGYQWLIYLSNMIDGNYQLVFFIFSLLSIFFFYKGFKYFFENLKTYFLLATLLFIPFFYFYSLNGMRQALATAIFFYSIKFILERKLIQYLFWIIVAVLFHKSAIILLPLYWILDIRYRRKGLFIFFLIGVGILFFNPLQVLIHSLPVLEITYYNYLIMENITVLSAKVKIITIFSFLIIIIFLRVLNRDNKVENIIFNAIVIFMIIRLLSFDLEVINRLSVYFKPFFVLFIIFILYNLSIKIKNIKNLLFISILLYILSYGLYGIYVRAFKDGSYNQYAINLCLFGKPCPVQIYGNYNNLYHKD